MKKTTRCLVMAIGATLASTSTAFELRSSTKAIRQNAARTKFTFPHLSAWNGSSWAEDINTNDFDDDDYLESIVSEQDWRAFRAKLVMGESKASATASTDRSSSTSSNAPFFTNAYTETLSRIDMLAERTKTLWNMIAQNVREIRRLRDQIKKQQSSEPAPAPAEDEDLDGIGSLFSSSDKCFSTAAESALPELQTFPAMTPLEQPPLEPSQWAYDAGKVIEQGAVILGGVEQEKFCFGLRQQYFHKAAILVLSHDHTFTKGIILNRPTNLAFEDDVNPGQQWRVWFGGDQQGLHSDGPDIDIVCLTHLDHPQVISASVPIMKDIRWTSFDNAKRLVKSGVADPGDFWVFAGYAGWESGQLVEELDRKNWCMLATDSQTLLKDLTRQAASADPRDAGLETWSLLMNMIGRGEAAKKYSGGFDDLILKMWAQQHLMSAEAEDENMLDQVINRVSESTHGQYVSVGTLLRASSNDFSPFLLDGQEFHKSVVLLIGEHENLSVGAILNRPMNQELDVTIDDPETGREKTLSVPLRYGGQFAIEGNEPVLWLHCKPALRTLGIGRPVGLLREGLWKCTSDEVTRALRKGLATPQDFLVVSGVSVWMKKDPARPRGIHGEVAAGNFEVVASSQTQVLWNSLQKQDVLNGNNLKKTLALAEEAWSSGASKKEDHYWNGDYRSIVPRSKLGGAFDDDDDNDDSLVFSSDVKVSKLSDNALQRWVGAFLLGMKSFIGTAL